MTQAAPRRLNFGEELPPLIYVQAKELNVATAKCGGTSVEYDEKQCSYTCECIRDNGCFWSVTCGKITVNGTGLVKNHAAETSVTVAGGTLAMVAKNLERLWKRSVIVPSKLRKHRIGKRRVTGAPEEVAAALGLRLGPKRKRR
jgi:hypothetical protein